MSHCGLCGAYINDCYSDWYLCDDCGPYPDSHQRPIPPEMLSLWDRVRVLFGYPPRRPSPNDSKEDSA